MGANCIQTTTPSDCHPVLGHDCGCSTVYLHLCNTQRVTERMGRVPRVPLSRAGVFLCGTGRRLRITQEWVLDGAVSGVDRMLHRLGQ